MKFLKKFKEKGLPVFLAKLFSFLAILFVLDYSIGSVLKYLYFKQDTGQLYRTTYSLDSTTANFLIFGSSTANHHYIPSAFKQRLGVTAYNTGRDANTILYNYAVFQSILKRYRPQAAILDFNVGEFREFQDSYDKISSLLPYYTSNRELDPIIEMKSPFEKYKLISKTYPFNSMLFTILIGNTEYNKSRDYINDQNGYIPLDHVWHRKILPATEVKKYALDSTKINLLKAFVTECKKTNIQLYICISPRFINFDGQDPSVQVVQQIAHEYNIPFYNFSKDSIFLNHPEYFADVIHLNNTGAEVFTNKVIDRIINTEEPNFVHEKEDFSTGIKEN